MPDTHTRRHATACLRYVRVIFTPAFFAAHAYLHRSPQSLTRPYQTIHLTGVGLPLLIKEERRRDSSYSPTLYTDAMSLSAADLRLYASAVQAGRRHVMRDTRAMSRYERDGVMRVIASSRRVIICVYTR